MIPFQVYQSKRILMSDYKSLHNMPQTLALYTVIMFAWVHTVANA